jgi:hypothetical protein
MADPWAPAETRLAWLLAPADAAPARNVSKQESELAHDLVARWWQLAPVVWPRVQSMVENGSAPADGSPRLADLATSVSALTRVQNLLCWRFARELESEGIRYTLLKGSAARLVAYDAPHLRGGLDVDIGVRLGDVDAAEAVARAQGFVPSTLIDEEGRHFAPVDSIERELVEQEHYELACLVRRQAVTGLTAEEELAIRNVLDLVRPWHVTEDGRLACYVTLDVHHGLCLDITVDDVVGSARRVDVGVDSLFIPAPEWLLFHLVFKIYWEGVHNYRRGVYQYADIIRFVDGLASGPAARLVELLETYHLEAAGHYVLRRLPSDFGVALPSALEEFVARTARSPRDMFPIDVNDLGDMWPKLWGYR